MHQDKRKKLTIVDIAKLSGVGKSTVSRVINNEAGVNPATKEKILQVIAENRFSPSKSARVLRGQQNKVVGIIVTRLDSSSENQAVRAIFPILYENDIDNIIVESQFDNNKVKEQLVMLENRQIDRLIVFAFTGLDFSMLSTWSNRLVVIARSIPDTLSICYDDVGAVNMLLNYLYHDKKNRKISFIGVEESDQTTGQLRYQAYKDFCEANAIIPNAYLGKLSHFTGYQYAKEAIQNGTTAIICATDTIALGLNKYLTENKNKTILVASVGSSDILRFLFPETIAVELGFSEAGSLAAKEIVEIEKTLKPKTVIVPSRILK